MKFIKHLLKYNKVNNDYLPSKQIPQPSKEVFSKVNENISTIKQIFSNTEDLVVKEFKTETVRGVLIYLETMVDKEKIQ
jgi:spore germination protein KA